VTTLLIVCCVAATTARAATSHHKPPHVIRQLDRATAGTPMQHTGGILEPIARRHRIHPFFIIAVAATESSIGRAACHNNPRNVWGLASCQNTWPVPYFNTWREAYTFYARFLTRRWPHARTAHDYHGYAACSSCWGRKTAYWMQRLFGVGPGVRYP
jgi:hypothetical protein